MGQSVLGWQLRAVKKGGSCVGKTKRGKGTKVMLVVEGDGLPIGFCLASANHHEVKLAIPTLQTIRVPRRGRGRPKQRPEELVADKAYDSRRFREWLRRKGIKPTIPSFERVFRGEGLMPSGIDALFEMELEQVLASVPQRLMRSWTIYIDGEEVLVAPEPIEDLGELAVRVVSQPALLRQVIEEARRCPSFAFKRGAWVRDLVRDPNNRVLGVQLEAESGLREVRADLIVGCDGRGSLVRTRAGLELDLLPEHYDVLWFKLPAPEALCEGCSIMMAVAANKHPIICYTSWDGRLQYGLVMPQGGLRGLREKDWVSESVGSAPRWLAEHVLATRDEIEDPTKLIVLVGRCREWTTPGLLLLGDAAHPMSPVRAQGINLALRDAVVTANHLVPLLRKSAEASALDAACRAIQAEREPEIVRAQRLQIREARGQGDAHYGSWRFRLAKHGAWLLGRYRWAQDAWLRRQHELRFGSTEVKLRVAP